MTFLSKIFDNVYKYHAVICISILILRINLRLVDLNIFMMSFLSAKRVQKRVHRNDSKFCYFLYVTYKISRPK